MPDRWIVETVGIVHPSFEAHQPLRIVELRVQLFELPFIHQQRRIEGGIDLEVLEPSRIESFCILFCLVALAIGLGTKRLIGRLLVTGHQALSFA